MTTPKPEIENITLFCGEIALTSEFNSSSPHEVEVSDHPLVRSCNGQAILRGESLAGVIRQELVRLFGYECEDFSEPGGSSFCYCRVCRLMGHSRILKKDQGGDPRSYWGSRLKISGGNFSSGASRIRHRVAISRPFQVAAAHRKHDVESLSHGATAPFVLELENPTEEELRAVRRLLAEMETGLISLGGKKGAGFGAVSVAYKEYSYDLAKREEVLHYLAGQLPSETAKITLIYPHPTTFLQQLEGCFRKQKEIDEDHKGENLSRRLGWKLLVPFDLHFPELFLSNDPLEVALFGSDHMAVLDSQGCPWLPPTSLRGVFRSRAEQIIRTLNPKAACDPSGDASSHPLRSCAASIEDLRKQKMRVDWPTWRDLESPNFTCLGCQLFGSTLNASRLRLQTGTYQKTLGHEEVLQHFLAICRFKGGGKSGAKFDALPLYNVTFRHCKLILEDAPLWQIGLLALVFKDLCQGDLRFGFGTRKGYGQALGSFPPEGELVLSTPEYLGKCSLEKLQEGDAWEKVKGLLQQAADAFRKRVQSFQEVGYARISQAG